MTHPALEPGSVAVVTGAAAGIGLAAAKRSSQPAAADLDADVDFLADAEASHFYGGPQRSAQAWKGVGADIGHWRVRGFGLWTSRAPNSDVVLSGCGLWHPVGWQCLELTWFASDQHCRRSHSEPAARTH